MGDDPSTLTQVFNAVAPAGVFYPLFAALVAVGLVVRWSARRWLGAERWARGIRRLELLALTTLLLAMLLFAVLQIVLRNFFQTGLVWIEPLLRHLVLWIGFTAAVVATGRLRHIQMDVAAYVLPFRARLVVRRVTTAVAAVICAVLARAAWIYLGQEQEFGSTGFLDIPIWLLTSVIFLGFALMAKRFASRALSPTAELALLLREAQGEELPDEGPPAGGPPDEGPPAGGPPDEAPPAGGPVDRAPPAGGSSDEAPPAGGPVDKPPPAGGPVDEAPPAGGPVDKPPPVGGPVDEAPPAGGRPNQGGAGEP